MGTHAFLILLTLAAATLVACGDGVLLDQPSPDVGPGSVSTPYIAAPTIPKSGFQEGASSEVTPIPSVTGFSLPTSLFKANGKETVNTIPGSLPRSGVGIEDKAHVFRLPSAAGPEFSSAAYIGKLNLVVVFYRAFW